MSENNSKINSIIEDIIDQNRSEFNKKTKNQQNKEKGDISDAINSIIADRDNEERTVILIELAKTIQSSQKSFFDSTGNIDIKELRELTNSTVRNAEKNKLITPKSRVETNKIDAKEALLTAILMKKMIDNYENLSSKDKINIFNDYEKLSSEDKKRLRQKLFAEMDKVSKEFEKNGHKKTAEAIESLMEEIIDSVEFAEKVKKGDKEARKKFYELTGIENPTDEEVDKFVTKDPLKRGCELTQMSERFNQIENAYKKGDFSAILQLLDSFVVDFRDIKGFEKISANIENLRRQIFDKAQSTEITSTIASLNEEIKGAFVEYLTSLHNGKQKSTEREDTTPKDTGEILEGMLDNLPEDFLENLTCEIGRDIQTPESSFENTNSSFKDSSEKVEKISFALMKYGFKESEIKEALNQYGKYLGRLSSEDNECIDGMLEEEFIEEMPELLKQEFQELGVDKRVQDILDILAEENFDGNFQKILVDERSRQDFIRGIESVSQIGFKNFGELQAIPIQDESFAQFFNRFQEEIVVAVPEDRAFEGNGDSSELVAENIIVQGNQIKDLEMNNSSEDTSSDSASQGSTSSGRQSFSIDSVKAVSMNAKMSQIQDNIQLVFSLKDGKDEIEETKIQDEEQTV